MFSVMLRQVSVLRMPLSALCALAEAYLGNLEVHLRVTHHPAHRAI
jgi:hypothetical protein